VINVATAYSRVGRHVREQERGTLGTAQWYLALERRALELFPELSKSPWAVSSLTWALGRTERDPGAPFWALLEAAIVRRSDALEPQGVANILWAFATLERPMPAPLRSAMVGRCRLTISNPR